MSKLRRILMFSHGSGSFYRARGFAEQLAKRGYEVDVVTIAPTARISGHVDDFGAMRIIYAPDLFSGRLRTGWDPWDTLWRIIRIKGRFDFVHSYDTRPVSILPALVAAKRYGAPLMTNWGDWWGHGGTAFERCVGTTHRLDRWFSPIETYFEEAFHRHAEGVVVMSRALRERAIGLGVAPNRLRIIHFGVDLERVKPQDKAEARKALGLPLSAPVYGYCGKIFPRDAQLFFNGHGIVQSSIPGALGVLIGNCTYEHSGPMPPHLIRTGPISHQSLRNWLAACDLLLLPLCDSLANRGRWPSKVPEYLAMERPVVATAVGDIADFFADGQIGIATDASPEAFAKGIVDIYSRSDRDEMGRRGRIFAQRYLSWSVQTDALEAFMEEIWSGSNPRSRRAASLAAT